MNPTTSSYRPDIDGLRALAVLAVLFFHAEFNLFHGGFVGVDVFFVISGFLITRLIKDQYDSGTFTFSNFYLRRARRLLPALFVTYILCWIAAYTLLSAAHLKEFGYSLFASLISLSNFFFWSKAGYFDTEAVFKPLLHTWSLSVEEQFYFVWPLCCILLLRKNKSWLAPLVLLIAGLISLALNQIFILKNISLFYLIPFRIYEFCIGALMVWITPYQPKNKWVLEPLLLIGLGLIGYSVVRYSFFDVFPSYNALTPCLGAALVIYSGAARYNGLILRNKPIVFVGLISYSLYLIHWPALLFYKYYYFKEISLFQTWMVLLFSFAAATAMYFWVEQPFRKGFGFAATFTPRQFIKLCLSIGIVIAFGSAAVAARGMPHRIAPLTLTAEYQKAIGYKECTDGYGICPGKPAQSIIIGDSHSNRARHLLGVIAQRNKTNIEVYTSIGCMATYKSETSCEAETDKKFDSLKKSGIKNVFLVSSWNPLTQGLYTPDFLLRKVEGTIKKLRADGLNVYVYGSMPFMHRTPSSCFQRPLTASCESTMVPMQYEKQTAFNQRLKETTVKNGAKYFDVFASLCTPESCRVAYEGLSLYGDRYHLDDANFGGYILTLYQDKKNLSFDDLFKNDKALLAGTKS